MFSTTTIGFERNDLSFSARLHKLRMKKGVTLREVSKATGLSHTSMVYYESGRRYPSKEAGLKLIEYFGVEWDELFGN